MKCTFSGHFSGGQYCQPALSTGSATDGPHKGLWRRLWRSTRDQPRLRKWFEGAEDISGSQLKVLGTFNGLQGKGLGADFYQGAYVTLASHPSPSCLSFPSWRVWRHHGVGTELYPGVKPKHRYPPCCTRVRTAATGTL